MATDYGCDSHTVRNHLADAGIRPTREAAARPPPEELRAKCEAVTAAQGTRKVTGVLAGEYGVTQASIRKWMADDGLRTTTPRFPQKPINEPCPCGAVATTRYRGQDPPLCFKCYMRTWAADPVSNFHRTGREYIAQVKADAVCADCGGKFPPACMHFDHVPERGPKLFNLGNGDYSVESIKAEIAKCDIVCANCHAVRTWTTRQQPWVRRGPVLQEQAPTGTDGVLF
jgi:hypothetical protein